MYLLVNVSLYFKKKERLKKAWFVAVKEQCGV